MNYARLSPLTAALCLSIYWFWVVVMLYRMRRHTGKMANAVPRETVGKVMRVGWYPCIALLIAALWITAFKRPELISIEPDHLKKMNHLGILFAWLWFPSTAWWIALIPVSLVGGAATFVTFVCWHRMGKSWRIGIDPGEKLALVSTGPYRYVRHPIYALRMVINVCAFIMAPVPLVLLTAGFDFLLLQIEARREERYMESKHGGEYARYKNSVGRFVPRAFVG